MLKRSFSQYRKVTHCIFDMDGLLLDTETIYEEVVTRILKEFQKSYPRDVRIKVLGTTEQKSADIVVTDLKLPITIPQYLERFHAFTNELMGNAELKPGAERLLKHLHIIKIPIALATGSGEPAVKLKTQNHRQLFNFFNHKVCGSTDSEVKEGKPAPDIFLVTAKRFHGKPLPSACLVFEDSPNGIKAANAAGMQSVMVPEEYLPKHLCDACKPTKILNSLENFKPEEFGLSAF